MADKKIYIGRKVRKSFGEYGIFEGKVKSFKHPYYRIVYTDGDSEEFSLKELLAHLIPENDDLKVEKEELTEPTASSQLKTPQKKHAMLPHSGNMICKCGHRLGPLKPPLANNIVHLNRACLWECCGQRWDFSECQPKSEDSRSKRKLNSDESTSPQPAKIHQQTHNLDSTEPTPVISDSIISNPDPPASISESVPLPSPASSDSSSSLPTTEEP